MSTTSRVLAIVAASALAGTALAQEASQETGAVSISAGADASADTPAPAAAPPNAAPPDAIGKWRVLAGLHFGFAGKLGVEVDTGFRLVNEKDPNLEPTVGLQAGVDYLLMQYFALGGELRLSWWKPASNITPQSQSDPDRSLFVDIDVKPRGRYVFSSLPIEVYGTLPLGLSFASMDDSMPMDGGPGFNLGLGAGMIYFLSPRFGVNTELLGVWHWFDGKLDVGADTDDRTAQLYWMLNAVLAI